MANSTIEAKSASDQKHFLITALIAVFAFNLPLILNNYHYRDDYLRASDGTVGWTDLGRPLGDVITRFITADWQVMTETSPLFLVLSLLVIVFSCCKSIQLRNIPFNILTASLFVTALFNPLYIECLLYRFDCLIMACGFACAVMAWGYCRKSAKLTFLFAFLALNFYQTFINVFIALVIAESLYHIYQGDSFKETFKFFIKQMLYAAIAILLYYILSHLMIGSYAEKKGTIVFLSNESVISHYLKMFENAYSRYFGFLSPTGKALYLIAFTIALIEIQLHFYKYTRYTLPVLRATLCSLTLLFFLPLSLGFLFAIAGNGPIAPRLIVGGILFSVMIAFLCIGFLSRFAKHSAILGKKICGSSILLWAFLLLFLTPPLAFSYIVNNMIRMQNEYDTYRVNKMVDILEEFPAEQRIVVLGSFSLSPILESTSQRMRLSRHLVPKSSDWTLCPRLKKYGLYNLACDNSPEFLEYNRKRVCDNKLLPFLAKRDFALYRFDNEILTWISHEDVCQKQKHHNNDDDPE